jgi:hypothetical protein
MATWVVQIEASFSDTVEVEADTWDEAMENAVREFESDYTVVNQYGLPWDDVQATEANEMDEDGNY